MTTNRQQQRHRHVIHFSLLRLEKKFACRAETIHFSMQRIRKRPLTIKMSNIFNKIRLEMDFEYS